MTAAGVGHFSALLQFGHHTFRAGSYEQPDLCGSPERSNDSVVGLQLLKIVGV